MAPPTPVIVAVLFTTLTTAPCMESSVAFSYRVLARARSAGQAESLTRFRVDSLLNCYGGKKTPFLNENHPIFFNPVPVAPGKTGGSSPPRNHRRGGAGDPILPKPPARP